MNTTIPTTSVAQTATDAYKAQRLTKAAHQFEAMMLGEMLKPLGKSDEDALKGSDSSGTNPLQSFGVEAIAGALANSGALGFAKQIEQALHKSAARSVENNHTKVSNES